MAAHLLRSLGIAGWSSLEPAILAALATESPLLLIGPHGTAKTLLLSRLAEALGLVFRHYNASILSFDDLLGYPVPQDGGLVYLQTPATIWEAEAVLFDEVSRCRPELQNKLFPLIHERVAQGLPLTRLRHRWAAMNPPPPQDATDGTDPQAVVYEGAEPLDVALADRFAFVLEVPTLEQLSEREQQEVLRGGGAPTPDASERLGAALQRCRDLLPEAERELRGRASEYVRVLAAKLATAGHPLSTRRAVTLVRNVEALRAAERTLEGLAPSGKQEGGAFPRPAPRCLEDSFYAAARFSIPDAAWGRPLGGHVLLGAHRVAWEALRLAPDAPDRALLVEDRPLHRIALALRSSLPAAEAGAIVADSFSALSRPARLVTSAVLFPRLAERTDLPAAALEAVSDAYATVARAGAAVVAVRQGGRDWKRTVLGSRLAELDPSRLRDRVLQNAAAALMADDERVEFDALVRAWDEATAVLAPADGPTPDGTTQPGGAATGRIPEAADGGREGGARSATRGRASRRGARRAA